MIIQDVFQDTGFLIKVSIPNTIYYSVSNLVDSQNNNQKALITNNIAKSQNIGDSYQKVTIQNNEQTIRIKIFK